MSVATPSAPSARPTPRLQARPSQATTSASTSKPVAARSTASRTVSARPAPVTKTVKPPPPSATPSASNAAFLVPGKDTSSSSGKVFAKPSKEWVLPERAKPGRKVVVEDPDDTRQSLNRQSQRAHRARRTDYISTLEERIRQFEADEIHSNVRLQEVARALKADNERLKAELLSRSSEKRDTTPKGWEEERVMLAAEIKSLREEVRELKMRARGSAMASISAHPSQPISPEYIASLPAPHVNRIRHIDECPICPDPDPDCPCQKTASIPSSHIHHDPNSQYSQRHVHHPDPSIPFGSTVGIIHSPPPQAISCGFCQSTDECICRMIDEEDVKPIIITPPTKMMGLEDGGCGLCADGGFCACAVARSSPRVAQVSLPTVSAAVPLRKLRSGGSNDGQARKSVWALDGGVVSASSLFEAGQRVEAVCSGDPSNCDACRNDTFGQEFCSNFFSARDPSHSCSNCEGKCSSSTAGPSTLPVPTPKYWTTNTAPTPSADLHPFDNTSSSGPLLMACCGNPNLCGHQSGGCAGDVIGIGGLIPGLPEKDVPHETIRVDQAWKTLKAHPNAKFASLAFLADIVAQRAQSHAAAAAPPSPVSNIEGGLSPLPPPSKPVSVGKLGLIQAGSGLRGSAMPDQTVNGDVGGKRKTVVETSAVRDALRLLDGTPAPSEDGNEIRENKRVKLA